MTQILEIGKHKTTVRHDEDVNETLVTYHNTVVVQISKLFVILDSGGWRTATTKLRMNQTSNQYDLGYQVFQKDFDWFVDHKDKIIPFEDGMMIKR